MNWLQSVNHAIDYIESNLLNDIGVEDVSKSAYTSNAHFQRIFNLVTGITIGKYIHNRRLSLAAQDLLSNDIKIIDIAMKYGYDTAESFTKAFCRFHGINPSEAKKNKEMLKFYYPLNISITVKGGFVMNYQFTDEFYWNDAKAQNSNSSAKERYQLIVDWAGKARELNPNVFDSLTEWMLNDEEWSEDKLWENEQILKQGVLARFQEQNAKLREYLHQLDSAGVVNPAVYQALDRFDNELAGTTNYEKVQNAVTQMFDDFSVMKDRKVRERIAGNKTGSTGTDSVELFGYINSLKECDAGVQWALFMPYVVENQQNEFKMTSFEYVKLPKMRFVGFEGEEYADIGKRMEKMRVIDSLSQYSSGFDYDLFFMHFYGKGVDVGEWRGVFGRFMKAETPVPDGFVFLDFVPDSDEKEGPPYLSEFAFATFEGNVVAMHKNEGYDGDAMYDVTRNTILGQNVGIPYPLKYWTAEVFLQGCDKESTAYLFSTIGAPSK